MNGVKRAFLRTDGNMSSNNLTPFLVKVSVDPRANFASKPFNVTYWIIACCLFAFGIGRTADIDYVDQGVGMS